MGHNVSAIAGVKSPNFYEQGNAINEIWVDDVELISRLPFGDSDLGQAGWPKGSWPKIPWHQFIIPLKRDLTQFSNNTMPESATHTANSATPRCSFGFFGEYGYLHVTAVLMIATFDLVYFVIWIVNVWKRRSTTDRGRDIDLEKGELD
ncbi:hypothetical protein N7478_004232 [Penicillium angulare]|uniref:uncharacterized protein n=1 Tax=Penicillium angulare TaxID=116970 RepID=UPI0025406C48|nr:uncharacterized protein N7478_004232 [Penicillium angulare]KAJ5278860.1 hypothetical protein N7478_004232 [Penicillium angulare]